MPTRAPVIGWNLPPFYCPIESQVHPEAKELEEQAVDWLDASGIFRDGVDRAWSIATHSTDFSCRMIPRGDPRLVLLFIMWNHWAFALDDQAHDTGSASTLTRSVVDLNARIARCLESPGSGTLDGGPLGTALEELATLTRAALTSAQLHYVQEGLRDWLFGASWQVGAIESDVMPSLSDYVAMRPSINGTRFSLAWSLAANGIRMTQDELYSAPVQALTDVAGFVVSCDNDLFSYAKEDSQETTDRNIINILMHHNRCPPQQAVAETVAIRDRCMTLFLRLRERIAGTAGPELRRYLESLGDYIAGCIHWMNAAPRYASPRNRHALPQTGASWNITWRSGPVDARTDPLPIPATAWWWDQLAR
ncbi:terpene synthase family protein [Streptomyces pathocidini]|uniref:terpene synthase family protein n=1 Tax=Streptomyces pathocidini TaxID=1650571 RepID=UPI0033C48F3E